MSAVNGSTDACSTAQKLQALWRVASYPVSATAVELIETHFAWVFLVGEYAYKMKKPIAYSVMDLRSLENRHRNCLAEVRLNRRLAPDVYLGAVPLVIDQHGEVKVGGAGSIIDWLVWMKRLPARAMLDRAMSERTATAAALDQVGALLAGFYERQQRYFIPARHYLLQLADRTARERTALLAPELRLDGTQVSAAVAAIDASFDSLQVELSRRAAEGRVVECHGDLRPEHICLAPLCIIDSLEFSRELRVLDRLEDLAFLRLECAVAGSPEVADQVLGAYRSAARDEYSSQLLYCYQACRALMRAKILAWHILDPTVASLAPWTDKAHAYIALANRCAALASEVSI